MAVAIIGVLAVGGAVASGAIGGFGGGESGLDPASSGDDGAAESELNDEAAILVVEQYYAAGNRADTEAYNELVHPDSPMYADQGLEGTVWATYDWSISDLSVTYSSDERATVSATETVDSGAGSSTKYRGTIELRAYEGSWHIWSEDLEPVGEEPPVRPTETDSDEPRDHVIDALNEATAVSRERDSSSESTPESTP